MSATTAAIWSFLLAVALSAASGAVVANEPLAGQPTGKIVAEFDIAKDGDIIVLPVTIQNKQYPFFLSVATTRTILDERLRPLLGRSVGRVDDPENSLKFDEFPALPMKIGSQSFTPAKPLLCGEFDDLREYYGHEAYGIVGLDFLQGRVVQIDFDRGKFRVLASFPEEDLLDSEFKPLTPDPFGSGAYTISLKASGVTPFFAVDTLFAHSLGMHPWVMEKLARRGALAYLQQASDLRSGRPSPWRVGLLDRISNGDWTHRNLSIFEQECNRVGLAYLSRFTITFNLSEKAHKYMYLTPGAKIDDPELFQWSGMEVILKNGKVTVAYIFPDRVAAKAGIEIGDVILQIDGSKADKFSMFEIRQTFTEQNWVRVKFRRPERDGRAASEYSATLENPNPVPPLTRPATRGKAKE